jgi:hypothetical protein
MPASETQDDLPLFTAPPPARPVIGYDATTVLRALADAPLSPLERDAVSNFKPSRKTLRRDLLYIAHLAERYGTARLAAGEIPYR